MSCMNAVFGSKNSFSREEKVHLYLVLHETRVWFIKLEDYTLGVYSQTEIREIKLIFLQVSLDIAGVSAGVWFGCVFMVFVSAAKRTRFPS